MSPFSAIVRRSLMAGALLVMPLLTACNGSSITEPVAARKSGYLTVSASVAPTKSGSSTTSRTPVPVTVSNSGPGSIKLPENTVNSGYNVTAY
jgi:hypothetical protein